MVFHSSNPWFPNLLTLPHPIQRFDRTWNCNSSAKPPIAAGMVMANKRRQRSATKISCGTQGSSCWLWTSNKKRQIQHSEQLIFQTKVKLDGEKKRTRTVLLELGFQNRTLSTVDFSGRFPYGDRSIKRTPCRTSRARCVCGSPCSSRPRCRWWFLAQPNSTQHGFVKKNELPGGI